MGKKKTALFILLMILSIFLMTDPAAAQSGGERHYSQTGHTIRSEFLSFFDSAPDPLVLFGYPITDEFPDITTKIKTQYFEKARFDLIYENGVPKVQPAALGSILYDNQGKAIPLSHNSAVCRTFENGIPVCHAFLKFYDAVRGDIYLGLPIAPVEERSGRLVQYFERARMEWRPELPTDHRVILADLGRVYYQTRIGDPARLAPSLPGNIVERPFDVKASAFVEQPLVKAKGEQRLYTIVQDQYFKPLSGAAITAVVQFPDGTETTFNPSSTNTNGISVYSFYAGDFPEKQVVQIKVQIEYKGKQASTSTWYRIWW